MNSGTPGFRNTGGQKGFSLIELMIAIVIVAILVSIALPSYKSHVVKSRRTDIQREMVSYGQALERWFTTNGTYQNSAANGCGVAYSGSSTYYTVTGTCSSATAYSISAAPVSGSSQASDGTQTLDNTGAKTGTWAN